MRKVDSFGRIDCQRVKPDKALGLLKECVDGGVFDGHKAEPVLARGGRADGARAVRFARVRGARAHTDDFK